MLVYLNLDRYQLMEISLTRERHDLFSYKKIYATSMKSGRFDLRSSSSSSSFNREVFFNSSKFQKEV
jgi:hypothetical protein